MATIGEKIRKIRDFKGIKQEDMADRLGISHTTYGKMERGETAVTTERLDQIAKILELSPQDIMAFDEQILFQFLSSASGCGYNIHNYGLSDNERKLYEDKVKLLEEKCEYLQKQLDQYKSAM